ncbi:RlpA-like double-psi beta-barrel-protein domain-containing protein-containing protein, partial [Zychaea mexicana]|uniref:RlpA-like double-psi beta-barrel-protein domain-containing protein-containing protein n=1 Tax=Zychaea mexicana TaxID=64656 RepID=UPI0022FEA815
TYSGTGTWFIPSTQGGSAGACGGDNEDDAQIVALNQEQYGDTSSKSDWCGKKVEISHNGKSTTATITDACPECVSGDLDLTQAVFKALESDLDVGELDISWKVVS